MPSKREAILDAAKAALTGITGVADASVFSSRIDALQRSEHPSVIIEPVSDSADRQTISRSIWTLIFQVSIYVRADIPDESSDTIVTEVHSKLMNDATLNGIVDLSPASVQWALHEADKPLGIVVMQFAAIYQTNTLDITS